MIRIRTTSFFCLNPFNLNIISRPLSLKKNVFICKDNGIGPKDEKDAKTALTNYINIGKLHQASPSQELKRIDELVKNYSSSSLIEESISRLSMHSSLRSSNFFVALAAPSMTGKTQLAFSVSSKLPFYFTFSSQQSLYLNFSHISSKLRKLAEYDYNRISELLRFSCHDQVITVGMLNDSFSEHPLESLDWMTFFSNREGKRDKIEYSPISIAQFCAHPSYENFKKKYYVFLDEFFGSPSLVLIRNLFRSFCFPCLVASTNAQVTNFIGASDRSGSRGDKEIWCAVFPHLPPLTKGVLNQKLEGFDKLKEILVVMAQNHSNEEADRMILFLNYLLENQVKNLRPGVSLAILDIIRSFFFDYYGIVDVKMFKNAKITVLDFLNNILKGLSLMLIEKKESIIKNDSGIIANVKLLFENSFNRQYSYSSFDSDMVQLVDKHFFYLKNPYSANDDPFVLLHLLTSEDLIVSIMAPSPNAINSTKYISIKKFAIQTYFKKEEVLLLLACLFLPIESTTTAAFFRNIPKQNLGNLVNLKAYKRSGLIQENMAHAAIIDSSHYTDTEIEGTLRGVSLKCFLKNLLNNFNPSSAMKKSRDQLARLNLKLIIEDKNLEKLVESYTVPFLFPSGLEWPLEFKQFIPSKYLGTYHLTPDISEIDGYFSILNNQSPSIATIESKNWSVDVSVVDYTRILEKSMKFGRETPPFNNVQLQLSIFRSSADIDCCSSKTLDKLKTFCEENHVNILKIVPLSSDKFGCSFRLVQASQKIGIINEKPALTSIILDLDAIESEFEAFEGLVLTESPN